MKRLCLLLICCCIFKSLNGQVKDRIWIKSFNDVSLELNSIEHKSYTSQHLYNLNLEALNHVLRETPKRNYFTKSSHVVIRFPNEKGVLERFQILEAPSIDEELQNKFPSIKSFVGKGVDDSKARIRFSLSKYGIDAIIKYHNGKTIHIKPIENSKHLYQIVRQDKIASEPVNCELETVNSQVKEFSKSEILSLKNANDGILRTYRLALATTGEFSQYQLSRLGVSPTASVIEKKEAVLSALNETLTSINAIYELDFGISMQLIANNDAIIFLDPATDNFSGGNLTLLHPESGVVINDVIGFDNYDLGHVFDYAPYVGKASLATVCTADKGIGVSMHTTHYGFIRLGAHELGHQFGAYHTYNSCNNGTYSIYSVEPGSGSSIMSYKGNCQPAENVEDPRIDNFHYVNILSVWDNITNGNSTCGVETLTSNNPPVISSIPNYTIPISTPFSIRAEATDVNNDFLTYSIDQIDHEATTYPLVSTATQGPLFRSYPPHISPERTFPNLQTILDGNVSNTWEVMPSVSRTMEFAATVRDNNIEVGQTASATTTLTFDDTSGPFLISNPSTSEIWAIGSSKTISWDVANTTNALVNCSQVNILLSIDGGLTYPITLASNTSNDGSEMITVPDNSALHGRIKVEAVNNIFFDVSPEIEISIDGNPNTTEIPDSNFELALRNLGFDTDGVENGLVFTRDIDNITTIDISSSSISDLTGIEDFRLLTVLDCSSNSLSSLNFNSNLFLEELRCTNNLLTQIDISQNTALKKLHSYYNFSLGNLDVSNNIELVELRCYYNNLSVLDIFNNVNLSTLMCYNNQLANLDTSGNTALSYLNCQSNQLTTLDVSINLELTTLFCSSNQFSSLDLTQNSALINLNCSSNNLSSLKVKNGKNEFIGIFNASNNPDLYCIEVDNSVDANAGIGNYSSWIKDGYSKYYVDCGTTNIPDSNFEQYLIDSGIDEDGTVNQKVVTLDISDEYYITLPANANITDITGVEDFINLYGLSISFNTIPNIDVSNNLNLNSINAQNSGLTSLDISSNTLLTTLGISGNLIEDLDLTNNTNLTFINVSSNQLKKLDISLNSNVTRLFCANNNLEYLNVQNGNNTNFLYFDALNNPELYCIKVDDEDYSTTNWQDKDAQSSYSTSCDVVIAPKIYLQGASVNPNPGEENLMRDDLRALDLLPNTSPYTDGLSCDSSLFLNTGSNAIVDWVLIEIRDETENTKIVGSQSALLQRDGDVVTIDGVSELSFWLKPGTYFVSVKHRNHLGILSANSLALNETTSLLDYTNGNIPTHGSDAQTALGVPIGIIGLWGGNSNNDTVVQYSGATPDGTGILSYVLNHPSNFLNLPTFSIFGYSLTDLNMDGYTQYAGGTSEMPFVLQNVLSNPSNFLGLVTWPINEQLPGN